MSCLRASKHLILFRVCRVSLSLDGYLCRTYRTKEKTPFKVTTVLGWRATLDFSFFFYKKGEFLKRWACNALHWIFITSTVTAKCFSCVCEVVSFNVRKNSFATLILELAAWGHNFNKVVLNETWKTYLHTAIIRKHAMEVSVRAQSLFYPKAISYVWRWWVGVFWKSNKSTHKTDLPLQH